MTKQVKSVKELIELIPENGAVHLKNQMWEQKWDESKIQAIGKINDRLEFFEVIDGNVYQTVYIWDFKNFPKEQTEYFDDEQFPITITKIVEGVFI